MEFMFNECHQLKEIIGIENFHTPKVTNMKGMFQQCNLIEKLDLSNFNTTNVTEMSYMFNECHQLKKIIGIEKFHTPIVTNMKEMFTNVIY